MINSMVEMKVHEVLNKEYPHVKYPATMLAKVVHTEIVDNENRNYIRILKPTLEVDEQFPEIPSIKSADKYSVDDMVVVTLLYGKPNMIHIFGKVD